MSDFKEQIKRREDALHLTVGKFVDEERVEAPVQKFDYDGRFASEEVSQQERFRREYARKHKRRVDDVVVKAPQNYAPEDVSIEIKKIGYWEARRRKKTFSGALENWKERMEETYSNNTEDDGYGFDIDTVKNNDTVDLMLSTRRFLMIEDKKKELADQIITEDAMNALKERSEVTAKMLADYKEVIMKLGPSLETVPDQAESATSEIRFTEESVTAYTAFLRLAASDPVTAIRSAIMDTVHTVTSFPEKMVEEGAVPQTFDRLMQIRNRYHAINDLRKHRQIAGKADAARDPLGALMTELYPREDLAIKKQKLDGVAEEDNKPEHDESANFKLIKYLEKALNSDLRTTLNNAGVSYRRGLFGSKEKKDFVETKGNLAFKAVIAMKRGINSTALSPEELAHKKALNKEYWFEREQAAYTALNEKLKKEEQPAKTEDNYRILEAVSKIKKTAEGKKDISYNKVLAERLEKKIGKLSNLIDDLKFKVDQKNSILDLDQVKMSHELTERIKVNSDRAQYDLVYLLERARGYINAYDHTLSGSQLDKYGSAIMDEMRSTEVEDGFTLIREEVDDKLYSTEGFKAINQIVAPELKPEVPKAKSDRDMVTKIRDLIVNMDKESRTLMNEIISAADQNAVLIKIADYKARFEANKTLINGKLKNGQNAITALLNSIPDEEERKKAKNQHKAAIARNRYVCTYGEYIRAKAIHKITKGGDLRPEIVLTEGEKRAPEAHFSEKEKSLKLLLDKYQKEISDFDTAQGQRALEMDPLAPQQENMRDKTLLQSHLDKAVLDGFSDEAYVREEEQIQPPPVQEEPHIEEERRPRVEEEAKPKTRKVRKYVEKKEYREIDGTMTEFTTGEYIEVEEPIVEEEENEEQWKEREKREREERERQEREREEREREERQRREEQQNNGGGQENPLQDNNVPPYERRVKSENAMRVINEGSLKTTRQFVTYLRSQLSVINKIGQVTWDELKKEAESWLVGRELIQESSGEKVVITKDNVTALVDELRQKYVDEKDVVDASQFTEEDNALFADPEGEAQYQPGSVAQLANDVIHLNTTDSVARYASQNLPANAVEPDLQNAFKKRFYNEFSNRIALRWEGGRRVPVANLEIPEADSAHVRWLLDHLPQNVASQEAMSEFRKQWNRKVGYDLLHGKKLDPRTYRKIDGFFNAWKGAQEITEAQRVAKRIKDQLKTVDTKVKMADASVGNEESIPNVRQWYGLSCWATSASLISNWYMKNKLQIQDPPEFDQMTFLDPSQLVINPYAEELLRTEQQNETGNWGFSREYGNIKSFVQPAGSMGNTMCVPDIMLANMSNTAVRHLRFNIPQNDKDFSDSQLSNDDWTKLSQLFFNKISELMQNGSGPISMLIPGHYRTIIGFKDGKLRCRDSGTVCVNGDSELDIDLEGFRYLLKTGFRAGVGYSCDFVFLQKLDGEDKEQLQQKYKYEYDENGKLKYTEDYEKMRVSSPENMMHNLGIIYSNEVAEPQNLLERFLKDEIYVPKNLDHKENVKDVTKQITETRKKLGLPDPTDEEKNRDAQSLLAYRTEAQNIRARKAEEWKNRKLFPSEIAAKNEEIRQQKERQIEYVVGQFKIDEDEQAYYEQLKKDKEDREKREKELAEQRKKDLQKQEEDRRKQEEDRRKLEEERKKNAEVARAKEIFGDRYTDEEKDELVAKTKNFDKFLSGKAKLKDKEKAVAPTALDVINGDYELKEKALLERKPEEAGPALGWLLSAADMQKIQATIAQGGNVFANKSIESKESTLADRNTSILGVARGDISKFNHLPSFAKEFFGRNALDEMFRENKYYKAGVLPPMSKLTPEEKQKLAGKTRDPRFRAAINMIIARKAKDAKNRDAARTAIQYDEYMNRQLILQTLAPMSEEEKLRLRTNSYNRTKKFMDGRQGAETMIENNMTKQRHLAKTLLLMQLGRFDRTESDDDGNETTGQYDLNVSEALAHGMRVGISLPAGTKEQQQAIYNAWQGEAGNLMSSRMATHDLHRRKLKDPNSRFKEVKLKGGVSGAFKYIFTFGLLKSAKPTSISNNLGMNLALGGLGKEFNNGVIDDQGGFGHLYQRYVPGDEQTCGGMLVGIENSAPIGMNFVQGMQGGYSGTSCIGEHHDTKALSHNQSAFFSGRRLIGDQYGGRTVDLSHVDATVLANILTSFDAKYKDLQQTASATIGNNLKENEKKRAESRRDEAKKKLEIMNQNLSGKPMTAQKLVELLAFLGIDGRVRTVKSLRSTDGADPKKYKKEMSDAKAQNNHELDAFLAQYEDQGAGDDAGDDQDGEDDNE